MTLVTRKFIKKNKELIQMSDRFDYEFRDRSQLLIPNSINFHDSDIRKKINDIVIQTDKINILQVVGREVFTVLILLITPFIESGNDVQVVLFITTYFLGLTFGALGIVTHFSNISIAEDRLKGLETTFSAIINIQNNMDQSRFDLLKDRIDDTSQAILPIKLQKGLFIQELSLSFGRGVERKKLRIANTHFQPKRFSLITGVSGAGKSVLGRAITLIYGDTVDYNLYLNNKKVTNYQSLYKAQEDLHFSALREFNTSYRNALSAYISNTNINNTFYQEITQFKIQENLRTLSADILNFFEQNHSSKDIDKEYISRILKTDPNPEIIVRDLLSKTFRSMSPYFSYSEELEKLRKVYSENQIRMSELYAFVAQHLAWNQLLRFIPKATFFYMDAVLSEPPISQGQRRRVLLAIDLYITGPLMVIDEPFANLDVETSRSILREIIKYAEENNSVLLIIDHKYKPDIYEGFESRLDKVVKIKEKEDSIVTAKTIS
jgi:ABC-type lipoprotein export system ATPase subunit